LVGGLFTIFLVLFIKIGISDAVRIMKQHQERKSVMKENYTGSDRCIAGQAELTKE
jgi:hypothetical protein